MEPTPDPLADFDLSNYLPYLFRHIGSQMEVASAGGLANFGVNAAVFRILAVLFHHGDVSHTELAHLTSIEVSTLSRVSDAVQRRGLIRRKRADEDQRIKRVTLTDKGRDLIESILPSALQSENEMFARVSPRDRRRLIELLHKVVVSLNRYSETDVDIDIDIDARSAGPRKPRSSGATPSVG